MNLSTNLEKFENFYPYRKFMEEWYQIRVDAPFNSRVKDSYYNYITDLIKKAEVQYPFTSRFSALGSYIILYFSSYEDATKFKLFL